MNTTTTIKNLFLGLGLVATVAACGPGTTLELVNASSGDVLVSVDGVDTEVAQGATAQIDLDVPVLNKTSSVDYIAIGDFVFDAEEELTVTVGEANPRYLEDNAGMIEVVNDGSSTIDSFYVTRSGQMDDDWVFGLGDWGTELGPIPVGSSVMLPARTPGSDYVIKWDGRVRVSPDYDVSLGQITPISISND